MFETMPSKAHQAHIAVSEPMNSIVQQGLSLGSSQTSPSLNPYYKLTFGSLTWYQVLYGGRQWQIKSGQLGLAWRSGILYLSQQYEVFFLTTKPSCQTWALHPYHQPKQKTWNPTNHSRKPNKANQTNHSRLFFLIQTALFRANLRKSYNQTALLRANLRISSETTFGLLTTTFLADTVRQQPYSNA